MTHFTPGPWDQILHGERDSRVGAKTLIAVVYSETFRDTANQHANARLIAQAPNMYTLVEMILEANRTAKNDNEMISKIALACEHAKAIVAAVEGK